MASRATEPPPAEPRGKARRRTGAFIAAFVALQFLAPLTYLGREDAGDERFTWRDFTSSGAVAAESDACTTTASIERADGTQEALEVEALIHRDWVEYVAAGRRAVVDAFLRKQCEAEGALSAELVNHCADERGVRRFALRCGGERAHESARTAAR